MNFSLPEDISVEDAAQAIWNGVAQQQSDTPLPTSLYRLQLHRHFTFFDAAAIVPYLAKLGISHVYASPYLKAREGSEHGYDIVDYSKLNPELGGEEGYQQLVEALAREGMGHVLDFVPNHMGVGDNANRWWMDVLENGPSSPYASFFDIDWMPLKPDLAYKVLLPVLGDQYGVVLEAGELQLELNEGRFQLRYYQRQFPISPSTITPILTARLEELEARVGGDHAALVELKSILTAIKNLPVSTDADVERAAERLREKEVIRRRLTALVEESPEIHEHIRGNVMLFNGTKGDKASFDLLDQLLSEQSYRLAYWRAATDEINYRRFFDVNDLAAICMEFPEVFAEAHAKVFQLLDEGKIQGLRIDHADGLYDPTRYLRELQRERFRYLCCRIGQELYGTAERADARCVECVRALVDRFDASLQELPITASALPLYVVVEKILGPEEALPETWPVHGTTGYEFLSTLNRLFVDPANDAQLTRIYARLTDQETDFSEIVYRGKKLIVRSSMASEVSVLGHQLDRLSERNRRFRDFTLNSVTNALQEIIACFPVYRTYITGAGVLDRDRRYVNLAVNRAKRRNPETSGGIFDFVRDTLLLQPIEESAETASAAQLTFVGRFQQVTGPVTAKGVEDTAFYIYNRLVSLNEVGGDPRERGVTPEEFHNQNLKRVTANPYSVLATTTHDTKRSEDVRARLNILSEMPREWQEAVRKWKRINRKLKQNFEGEEAPSRNDEYLLYQTFVGTRPFEKLDERSTAEYRERIQQYMSKAVREAKVHSSWVNPNEGYEGALSAFIDALLDEQRSGAFLSNLSEFTRTIAHAALWTSLSQVTLKLTSPGVPDTYRGTELWDFSLVDPDNRRPVDFERRAQILDELVRVPLPTSDLIESREDGRIKLAVVSRLLNLRKQHPRTFTAGDYVPVYAEGTKAKHICAFLRILGSDVVLVVVPRLIYGLVGAEERPPIGDDIWQDTEILIPLPAQGLGFRNVFTDKPLRLASARLHVSEALAELPVGVFVADAAESLVA
ncbi:MAG: malto-oligosyltrehalose synthase [Bdellovibrionota bacterium]